MFCQNCGKEIPDEEKFCPECQTPVAPPKAPDPPQGYQPPTIIINNTNENTNTNVNTPSGYGPHMKNKWVAFLLCFFLGYLGAHKFYEGKIILGVVYIFTFGLCGVSWIIDIILLLMKPNPYSV